jgi:hypothetical protein
MVKKFMLISLLTVSFMVILIGCSDSSREKDFSIFKSSKIDILRAFKDSLGLAFGINFIDIIIFKIKDKSNDTAW